MPKMSETYNEDIVQWTDTDGTVKTAVVTVRGASHPGTA